MRAGEAVSDDRPASQIATSGRKPAARSCSLTKIFAREFLPGIGSRPPSPPAGSAAGKESDRFAARLHGPTKMESRFRVARRASWRPRSRVVALPPLAEPAPATIYHPCGWHKDGNEMASNVH